MENHFNDREFERLLKENADRYRMYPSEKVWNNVHAALHPSKKRYGYTAAAILLSAVLIISAIIYISPAGKPGAQTLSDNNKAVINNSATTPVYPDKNLTQRINPAITQKPLIHEQNKIADRHLSITSPAPNENLAEQINTEEIVSVRYEPAFSENGKMHAGISELPIKLSAPANEYIVLKKNENSVINAEEKTINNTPVMDDETEKRINEAIMALASQNVSIPSFKKQPRFTTQFYMTPTVSYRKLEDERNISSGYVGWQLSQSNNVNHAVKHKPAAGLDFGFETRYRLNNSFSIKAGLQFNIDRYDILAYYHPFEIATVAINTRFNRVDSIAAISNYRNSKGGYLAKWLENKYFQVSFPVGADLLLAKNKDISWGVSGTVLPTYLIGDGAYLISSNNKNYAKYPELMRRWNANIEGGTFIAYSTGRVNWQMGPNARYQLFSSYVKGYPVREHLFAFGFKVGASFQKKK